MLEKYPVPAECPARAAGLRRSQLRDRRIWHSRPSRIRVRSHSPGCKTGKFFFWPQNCRRPGLGYWRIIETKTHLCFSGRNIFGSRNIFGRKLYPSFSGRSILFGTKSEFSFTHAGSPFSPSKGCTCSSPQACISSTLHANSFTAPPKTETGDLNYYYHRNRATTTFQQLRRARRGR